MRGDDGAYEKIQIWQWNHIYMSRCGWLNSHMTNGAYGGDINVDRGVRHNDHMTHAHRKTEHMPDPNSWRARPI